jgi:hypothetical protein
MSSSTPETIPTGETGVADPDPCNVGPDTDSFWSSYTPETIPTGETRKQNCADPDPCIIRIGFGSEYLYESGPDTDSSLSSLTSGTLSTGKI